ncbi:MAG: GGDEF domain-containing protein [Oleiphilaceae bacterium]|nr:GGDEF domain-containing protein [Oleiphilaceae bacterium]
MTQCVHEQLRLEQLSKLNILDSPDDPAIDRITQIAKSSFNVKIAIVSLVSEQRQWFKSRRGIDVSETPRDIAFCHHAIMGDDVFVIEDALTHPTFKNNPLVTESPQIRFYAAAPLHEPLGFRIGTLCIIDNKPRTFTTEETKTLRDLANIVEEEIARKHCNIRSNVVVNFPKVQNINSLMSQLNNSSRQSNVQQLLCEIMHLADAELGLVFSLENDDPNNNMFKMLAFSDPGSLRSPLRMARNLAKNDVHITCHHSQSYQQMIADWLCSNVLAESENKPSMIHIPVMTLGKLTGTICLVYERQQPNDGIEYALAPITQSLAILIETKRIETVKQTLTPKDDRHRGHITGLPNLNRAMIELEERIQTIPNSSQAFCIYLIDIDNFSEFNREHGTDSGDQILESFAKRLEFSINKEDYLAQVGGDEFLLISSTPFNRSLLEGITQRLCKHINGHDIEVSIGTAGYPEDSTCAGQLMRFASKALFDAKVKGKHRIERFDHDKHEQQTRVSSLRDEIDAGIDRQEFQLFYQPKVNLIDGHVTGFEALLRWQHPDKGLLFPDAFLPAIHNTDLEQKLGRFVLNTAGVTLSQLESKMFDYSLSINISPRHFLDKGFVSELRDCLAPCGESFRSNLVLEIVETAALENKQVALEAIKSCQSLGMKVSLDDFGKGYSSLSYFRELPWDEVKIDRSFVFNLLSVIEDAVIVESVINLCKRFGRQVVAEGIESEAHARKLQELGCEMGQGFWYSKALPLNAALEWAQQHTARSPHAQR